VLQLVPVFTFIDVLLRNFKVRQVVALLARPTQ
jgi:hypothetical protein